MKQESAAMAFNFAEIGHNSTMKCSASILLIKSEFPYRAPRTPDVIPQLVSRYFVRTCRQYFRRKQHGNVHEEKCIKSKTRLNFCTDKVINSQRTLSEKNVQQYFNSAASVSAVHDISEITKEQTKLEADALAWHLEVHHFEKTKKTC